jgi:SAM-dependent methyltransferase
VSHGPDLEYLKKQMTDQNPGSDAIPPPSDWVVRFSPWLPTEGSVLDLACGAGRHSRFFLQRGYKVVAVDRNLNDIADIRSHPKLESFEIDLEDGRPFPFRGQSFAAVIVTNYLYRPILKELVRVVSDRGILIYETFARGNERFRGPTRPDFLLKPGELLEAVRGELRVVAYEDRIVSDPSAAAIQRIAAVRETT